MLENLISKYRKNDVEQIVYRLSYAGKYIIIKGKTLAGSLIIISKTYDQYKEANERFAVHLYRHLYDHFNQNEGGRFRIKTFAKKSRKIDQYMLLKREQMELDKARFDPSCLNNTAEAYIPVFNSQNSMFGWLSRHSVMNFKKWLSSKERANYVKRYSKRPAPKPARNDL